MLSTNRNKVAKIIHYLCKFVIWKMPPIQVPGCRILVRHKFVATMHQFKSHPYFYVSSLFLMRAHRWLMFIPQFCSEQQTDCEFFLKSSANFVVTDKTHNNSKNLKLSTIFFKNKIDFSDNIIYKIGSILYVLPKSEHFGA